MRVFLLPLCVVALSFGCGGGVPSDGDASTMDAGPACTETSCDDGLFCNGLEHCDGERCVAGELVACDDEIACTSDACSEDLRGCVSIVPDEDRDGSGDAACVDLGGVPLGDDCDDRDDARFPGNEELCDTAGHDEDCDETTLGGRDGDGDGFVDVACCNGTACGDDCNDARPGVSPDATEVCNLVDDDCNGVVDEGTTTDGFLDADRDGHGDASQPRTACGTAVDFSPYDDDCDDTNILRSPTTPELCDLVDNDCDTNVDEAASAVDWYVDADGDGFGSATASTTPGGIVSTCTPPTGYSLRATDCDDADRARSPGVAELCDGIDQDCNGEADFVIGVGDLEDDDRDGIPDGICDSLRGRDCDDRDAATGPGEAESCDGRDNDCDTRIDEAVTRVAFHRDRDGDGYGADDDLIVGCSPMTGYVRRGGDCDDTSVLRRPGATEGCNAFDDDCDVAVEQGEAPRACAGPHSVAACVRGTCAIECDSGYGDCTTASGCESSLASSSSCGRCGVVCGAGESCLGGTCAVVPTAGLVAWLDANDPGIVEGSGNAVVSWPNHAGGADFVPFGTAPTLVALSRFGVGRSVRFVAGGVRSTSAIFSTLSHTIFVVALPTNTNEEDLVGTDVYVGPDGEVLLMLLGSSVIGHHWRSSGLGQPVSPYPLSPGVPVIATEVSDLTTTTVYSNGMFANTVSTPAGSMSVQPVFVGSRCDGCYAPGQYQGELGEVLVYDRALSPTEIDGVHAYLRAHWGI